MKNNSMLREVIWGNRFFVNAQLAIGLVNIATKYLHGEVNLNAVFYYARAAQNQKKVKLHQLLKREVLNILELEKSIKTKEIMPEDKKVIAWVVDSSVEAFTQQSMLKE